jgi:hypothetical protein
MKIGLGGYVSGQEIRLNGGEREDKKVRQQGEGSPLKAPEKFFFFVCDPSGSAAIKVALTIRPPR